ncbi:MAG: alpha/beta hydrolase [Chloroflexi bacterium]|nr:alpha/beta hydrolase [Chloroflexota bacterium]
MEMVSQHNEQILRIGGGDVQVASKGSGEALVYLHGAFGYRGWHPFLDALAEDFTVYAPVQPGFVDGAPGPADIDDMLDLTLYYFDLLEALGLEAPNVVGHFLGGMIAAEMAALRPTSVGKLVLAAPAGLWLDDDPGVDYFATPANELRNVLFSDANSEAAKYLMPEAQDDLERGTQIIERVRSLATVGKFLWPIPDKGLKKRMSRIKADTLVVVGEQDKIVPPSYGGEFASRISGATAQTMTGTGHMMMIERTEEFAGVVKRFLRG